MAEFKIPINRFDTNLLPPEARVAHTPTEAELRSADPNGDLPET